MGGDGGSGLGTAVVVVILVVIISSCNVCMRVCVHVTVLCPVTFN